MATKYNNIELGVIDSLGNVNVMYPITTSDNIACEDGSLTTVLSTYKSNINTNKTNIASNTTKINSLTTTVNGHTTSISNLQGAIREQGNTLTNHAKSINDLETNIKPLGDLIFVDKIKDFAYKHTVSSDNYLFQATLPNVNFTTQKVEIPIGIIELEGLDPNDREMHTYINFSYSKAQGGSKITWSSTMSNFTSSCTVDFSVVPIVTTDNLSFVFTAPADSNSSLTKHFTRGIVSSFILIAQK